LTSQLARRRRAPPAPLYARIQSHIRDGIAAGRFAPGARLPSENELAAKFGTTRATVARALQQLVFERTIRRRPGAGTFVGDVPVAAVIEPARVTSFEDAASRAGLVSYRLLGFAARGATKEETSRLGLPPGDAVHVLERLRLLDGCPLGIETRIIPQPVGARMTVAALQARSMHAILEDLGLKVARVEGEIRAAAATAGQARQLKLPRGSPLLIRDYLLMDSAGQPLVLGESCYRQSFRLHYRVQEDGLRVD
jgi:GntR family transcriptional regulator